MRTKRKNPRKVALRGEADPKFTIANTSKQDACNKSRNMKPQSRSSEQRTQECDLQLSLTKSHEKLQSKIENETINRE